MDGFTVTAAATASAALAAAFLPPAVRRAASEIRAALARAFRMPAVRRAASEIRGDFQRAARAVWQWGFARWLFRYEVRRDIDRLGRSPSGMEILREMTPGLPPGE